MPSRKFEILDAHTHFFSYHWLEHFYQLANGKFKSVLALSDELKWELPPVDPRDLGKKWLEEQDENGISKQVLFASKLNDAEFLAAATGAFPDRLIGYVMIDPTDACARNQTLYSLSILGMRGILLFPAMHHFHASDAKISAVYEEAASEDVPVFIHFGQLKIPIYQKIGVDDHIDLTYSNPTDLLDVARDFTEVNFIIPHFGCGRFDEALKVASECDNVYFDTASSNSWIQPPLTLRDVFRKTIEVIGPQRILFGTDSSFFPRGWRKDIFEQQFEILQSLDLPEKDIALILGGNLARILRID